MGRQAQSMPRWSRRAPPIQGYGGHVVIVEREAMFDQFVLTPSRHRSRNSGW